ncbi:MAG: retroviral-like aspartic protease family protein, partial [Candidatus Omnitrophica bacterium]|nr:retroviral-like aspartic protease family protein [Candidatus Omnitrophota bacterium]
GNRWGVRVMLEGKVEGRFILDTGASVSQSSKKMAARLKIKSGSARVVPVSLAGGGVVPGHAVILNEVDAGGAAVEHVNAIVLDYTNQGLRDGLLGMSFLENFIFEVDAKKARLVLKKRSVAP